MHLYETHLPVADTRVAEKFYREIVGLPFAYRDPTRDIVFLWVDRKKKAMIGLWGPNTGYGRQDGIAQKVSRFRRLFGRIVRTDRKVKRAGHRDPRLWRTKNARTHRHRMDKHLPLYPSEIV